MKNTDDFIEALLIRIAFFLAIALIGVIIHFISGFADKTVRKRNSDGYGCVCPGFKLRCIVPALFFIFTGLFVFCYAGASMDGYMDAHPQFRYAVIATIAISAGLGVLFIYIFGSMRIFYKRDELIKGRPFGKSVSLSPYEIERIELVGSSGAISAAAIHTLSDGIICLDCTYDGFDSFCAFALRNWQGKCELKATPHN